MPLPSALLARLQKRGIVKKTEDKQEEIEEVFAEDYDDPSKEVPPEAPPVEEPPSPKSEPEEETDETKPLVHEVLACPNKANPYHHCEDYCREKWGLKTFEPDPNMVKRRERMLRKYPLPEGWEEVADPGTARYYYWHVQTDQVSWLSPAHPRSEITMPAEKTEDLPDTQEQPRSPFMSEDELDMNDESDLSSLSSDTDSEEDQQNRRKRAYEEELGDGDRDRDRGGKRGKVRGRGRGRSRVREELDPMDPASYSEVPRGTWSTGLDIRGEAKTGVDITASGPLFQQRPYPSPGDVLRANRAISDQKR